MTQPLLSLESQLLTVVDVETTGLFPAYGDRICEVGVIQALGDEILDSYQVLVDPQRPISPGASRVNGLRDEDFGEAPYFVEIAEVLHERIHGALLVCHNAPFDLGFLDAEFSRLGQSWQPAGVIDTLEIARSHFHFHSNSLASLAAELGIANPQAHRALGDAMTTLGVLQALTRRLAGRGLFDGALLRQSYISPTLEIDETLLPPLIQEALVANRPVEILYIDGQGAETRRRITPLHLLAASDTAYLVAYCHLRRAERQFRLDRIVEVGRVD